MFVWGELPSYIPPHIPRPVSHRPGVLFLTLMLEVLTLRKPGRE